MSTKKQITKSEAIKARLIRKLSTREVTEDKETGVMRSIRVEPDINELKEYATLAGMNVKADTKKDAILDFLLASQEKQRKLHRLGIPLRKEAAAIAGEKK